VDGHELGAVREGALDLDHRHEMGDARHHAVGGEQRRSPGDEVRHRAAFPRAFQDLVDDIGDEEDQALLKIESGSNVN
jgi:hypothetical protein